MQPEVIIGGGGIAGLTAANYLHRNKISFLLIEKQDAVGGRVRSDYEQGFILDRGFQVFQTAYPEAKAILDYKALDLRSTISGAVLLGDGGSKHFFADPLRHPALLLSTLRNKSIKLYDLWRFYRLTSRLKKTDLAKLFGQPGPASTRSKWRDYYRFSDDCIQAFLKPFFKGVFLEGAMDTDYRMFEFVMKMFAEGEAAIPSKGMQAISNQLTNKLPSGAILLNNEASLVDGTVRLTTGQSFTPRYIIWATDAITASRQFDKPMPKQSYSTIQMYFATEKTKLKPRAIHLVNKGMINNMINLTSLSPLVAPKGQQLLSVSLDPTIKEVPEVSTVVAALQSWYPDATSWQHIKTNHIMEALPIQSSVHLATKPEVVGNVIFAGDYTMMGSLNAAMRSGRLAAEFINQHKPT